MYHVMSVFKFLAEHRDSVGNEAPGILLRVFRAAEVDKMNGMFASGALHEIMGGNENLVMMYAGVALTTSHITLAMGCAINRVPSPMDTVTLLYVLFGRQIPPEIISFFKGESRDEDAFNALLQAELRRQGVAWDIPVHLAQEEGMPSS